MTDDPVLHDLRERITAVDGAILDAVNARIELVALLKAHKDALGLDFFDPGREEMLLRHLQKTNPGPLSADGVRELFTTILALVKREL